MKKINTSVCIHFSHWLKMSKKTHSVLNGQKGLLLPFKPKMTEYERIQNIVSAASEYPLGPLFIKDDQLWVTYHGANGRQGGSSLAKEEDLLQKRLARKLANYRITVRIEA
ncbi:hypothetical protein [Peribacillus deserti]|uniref:Uncharacterized protein n=1 Tax=Peribacillus deserti TaxID=673318 RepID=A0A2N5MBE4_9BACI|nr:hypothetical protein [Peribacillus deserti]PLT31682.1 hypothetical protein CUU66_00515 [Peribacillus deserti]